MPLLAYDKKNNRLGYGKGYYDHYLNNQKKNLPSLRQYSYR